MPVRSFHIEDLLDYAPDDKESRSLEQDDNQQELEVIDVDDDLQEPVSSFGNRHVSITDRKNKNKEKIQHSEGLSIVC